MDTDFLRGLLIALVILIVCGGFYFWIQIEAKLNRWLSR